MQICCKKFIHSMVDCVYSNWEISNIVMFMFIYDVYHRYVELEVTSIVLSMIKR